jgi:hypothetical protein
MQLEGLVLSGSLSSNGPPLWAVCLPGHCSLPLVSKKFGKVSSSEHCYLQSDDISLDMGIKRGQGELTPTLGSW